MPLWLAAERLFSRWGLGVRSRGPLAPRAKQSGNCVTALHNPWVSGRGRRRRRPALSSRPRADPGDESELAAERPARNLNEKRRKTRFSAAFPPQGAANQSPGHRMPTVGGAVGILWWHSVRDYGGSRPPIVVTPCRVYRCARRRRGARRPRPQHGGPAQTWNCGRGLCPPRGLETRGTEAPPTARRPRRKRNRVPGRAGPPEGAWTEWTGVDIGSPGAWGRLHPIGDCKVQGHRVPRRVGPPSPPRPLRPLPPSGPRARGAEPRPLCLDLSAAGRYGGRCAGIGSLCAEPACTSRPRCRG